MQLCAEATYLWIHCPGVSERIDGLIPVLEVVRFVTVPERTPHVRESIRIIDGQAVPHIELGASPNVRIVVRRPTAWGLLWVTRGAAGRRTTDLVALTAEDFQALRASGALESCSAQRALVAKPAPQLPAEGSVAMEFATVIDFDVPVRHGPIETMTLLIEADIVQLRKPTRAA